MDEDKKYVRVARKLFVEQADKVAGGVAIVQGQRTANPDYACLFSGIRRGRADHRALECGNAFAAVPLFRQADGFLR